MSRSFTSKEQSVRKQWLILSFISILIWPLVTLGILAYIAKREPIPTHAYTYIITGVVLTLVVFYFLLRCAYLKQGIRFLTVCLVVGPLLKVKGLIEVARADHHDMTMMLSLFLNLAVFTWWYYLSIKLWKINRHH